MKNTLSDLNNHLFAQIERLGEENIDAEKLNTEIDRAKAITGVSKEIISNARLLLDAKTRIGDTVIPTDLPRQLT